MLRIFLTLYFTFVSILVLCADPLGSFAPEALRMTGAELRMTFCETLLAEAHPERSSHPEAQSAEGSPTSSLITYLSRLLDETLIGDGHLVRLAEGLEQGQVVNPISEAEAADFRLSVQRSGLEYLMQSGGFDPDALLTWAKEKLTERSMVRGQRETVEARTAVSFQTMEFVPIEERLEFGSFLVTQWQWAMVMGNNPSSFINGPESLNLEMRGKKIRMQPDHPVEMVSSEDADRFVTALNEWVKTNHPDLDRLIPIQPRGYRYRLPTAQEWQYVASGRGVSKGPWHFGDDESKFSEYEWWGGNSDTQTHAVGQKKPFLIDGRGIFDIYGNVEEWMQKRKYSLRELLWLTTWRGREVCGGNVILMDKGTATMKDFFKKDFVQRYVGFRLVRVKTK